jgi:hypothetical protein
MNRIAPLREQIDACRPGSDDLTLPELAALAQAVEQDRAVATELDRSSQFDRVVISALHEAPVPADLLDRLLAQAARNSGVADAVSTAPPAAGAAVSLAADAAVSPTAGAVTTRRVSRRWLIATSAIAAVAASLALGLGLFLPRPARNVSQSQLAESASGWYDEAAPLAPGWQAYAAAAPHSALRVRPGRSRSATTEYGPASVYECQRQSGRALLFVVKTPDRFAVATLPFTAVKGASRGLEIAAWQSGDVLYVLVLPKDHQRLEDFLSKPPAV